MPTRQIADRIKIRGVSVGSAGGGGSAADMFTKQMVDRIKIRSVSVGSAPGWGLSG